MQALPHPSRVSLARAPSLFRPLLPSACYAGYEKPNLQIRSSRNSPLSRKPLRYLVLARQTFRLRKNLSSWLILSRLAGNVYSFFQPFHGLTMSKYYEILREKCTLMYVDRCLVPVRRFPSPSWSIHFAWTTRLETLWPRAIMRPRDYAKWTAQRGRNTTQIHMQLATPQSMSSLRLPSRYMIYLVGSRSDVIDCGVELHQGF